MTIDELGVTITDFKTGHEKPEHEDQVRTYALLWNLDRRVNPQRRRVTKLVLSYPARERALAAPNDTALRTLEAQLAARIASADAETSATQPRALPSPDTCKSCHVRHLCGEYWETVVPRPASVPAGEWFDLEGVVLRRNGIKSWFVESSPDDTHVLVRAPHPSDTLPVGRRVRVLAVRKLDNPEQPGMTIAALGSRSESFTLDDAPS